MNFFIHARYFLNLVNLFSDVRELIRRSDFYIAFLFFLYTVQCRIDRYLTVVFKTVNIQQIVLLIKGTCSKFHFRY